MLGLEAFERAQVIQRVRPYGPVSVSMRKTPRYAFLSPSLRAALMQRAGMWEGGPDHMGRLLEDAVALSLRRHALSGLLSDVFIDASEGGADFVAARSADHRLVIEAGCGEKGIAQVVRTGKKVMPIYGMVVSDGPLRLHQEEGYWRSRGSCS